MEKFDVIVIGGGPAGVSAALYMARGGLNACIIHSGASALHRAHAIQNYYGAGTLSGAALYDRGLAQAREVGAEVVCATVDFASFDGQMFNVSTPQKQYCARRLVVATGAARKSIDIPGIAELEGKGVSYCAVCDAFFYRKKRVAVLGTGDFAKHELQTISAVAEFSTLLTNGEKAEFSAPETDEGKIKALFAGENGRLGGVEFEDGRRLELDGLFVALGVFGGAALAKSMGVLTDKNGDLITDKNGMTNIPGLYAAGDCTAGIKQVAKAAADGMNVGMSVIADIRRA